jgi:uncharacterized protein YoxC
MSEEAKEPVVAPPVAPEPVKPSVKAVEAVEGFVAIAQDKTLLMAISGACAGLLVTFIFLVVVGGTIVTNSTRQVENIQKEKAEVVAQVVTLESQNAELLKANNGLASAVQQRGAENEALRKKLSEMEAKMQGVEKLLKSLKKEAPAVKQPEGEKKGLLKKLWPFKKKK